MTEKEEVEDFYKTFFEQQGPEKVGNGFIVGKYKALILTILFSLPYCLTLLNILTINWILMILSLVLIIIFVLLIQHFKDTMSFEINPFDFVYFEFSFFINIIIQFGYCYYIIYTINNNNFNGHLTDAGFIDFQYFSMVTMSTVGYGDIIPISKLSRILIVFELGIGIWFLTTILPVAISLQSERLYHLSKKKKEVADKLEDLTKRGIFKDVDLSGKKD